MLLMTYCHDHPVALCAKCSEAVTFDRIGADIIIGRRDFCPMCQADLTTGLRHHLAECTVVQVQAREILGRARETRQDAREALTPSPPLRDDAAGPRRDAEEAPRSRSATRGRPRATPNGPKAADEAGEAVRESQRLRAKGREAIDGALQIGRDYIPVEDGRWPTDGHPRALTELPRAGMIPDDGRPCTPGPA
jgi:hypothetical protein